MVVEPKKMEILIVDDMPSNIGVLEETLKSDYNIKSAENGVKALELISEKTPDLILLDIMMPHMDGYEVCRKLKSQRHSKHIPVIFISAMDDVKDETRGFEVGAVDYITKPFKPVVVRARVRAHLKLKQYQTQLENKVEECKITEEEIRKLNQQLEDKIADRTEKLMIAQKEINKKEYNIELAEMSSGALHNVRNILNSVKISSEAIRGGIDIPLEGLKKANHILQKHIDEFSSFDPRIGKFFQYFLALEDSVENETRKSISHLNRLLEKVDMIEQIIIIQQEYGGAEQKEEVIISEVVDDALKIKEDLINSYAIKTIKTYHNVPPVYLQKARIMHILINLIKNAVEAMIESSAEEKQLNVVIDRIDDHVVVKITDNGCGISADSLNLLFSRGFTTKESGHGIGLHSSAQYMKEAGGALMVESDGKDKGATFTLVFPECK